MPMVRRAFILLFEPEALLKPCEFLNSEPRVHFFSSWPSDTTAYKCWTQRNEAQLGCWISRSWFCSECCVLWLWWWWWQGDKILQYDSFSDTALSLVSLAWIQLSLLGFSFECTTLAGAELLGMLHLQWEEFQRTAGHLLVTSLHDFLKDGRGGGCKIIWTRESR